MNKRDDSLARSDGVAERPNQVCISDNFGHRHLASHLQTSFATSSDAIALIEGERRLTYRELDRRTAALASELIRRGVGPEVTVALGLTRSVEQVIGILSILRAGGAFVPISLDDPTDRQSDMIKECAALILLAENEIAGMPAFEPSQWPDDGPSPDPSAYYDDDLAYILFTSGTTGKPKGVVVEHSQVIQSVDWAIEQFEIGPNDRVLFKSPLSFDIAIWEILIPLLSGGQLVIAPEGVQRDPRQIVDLIRAHEITTVHFIPTMLNLFLDVLEDAPTLDIKRVLTGGEALQPLQRDRVHRLLNTELHNTYGPTETTVTVAHWVAGPDDTSDPIPIGHPVSGTRLYVLDADRSPVSAGVVGDLWIAGPQVARGYLIRDALTSKRFVADPFVDGDRMYESGDLASIREDGAILYHGRSDTQIKIRGIRLELGEIEAALEAQAGVGQAVVVAHKESTGNEPRLAAFCTGHAVDEKTLRTALQDKLPAHAVPARIVHVDALPLTTAGKVDRKALEGRSIAPPKVAPHVRPRSGQDTATEIVDILADTVGMQAGLIDRNANFFDLGLSSIDIVQVRETLRAKTGRALPVADFFAHSTVAALAAHIDAKPVAAPSKPQSNRANAKDDRIAIVGMAGRFPGAPSVDDFWQGLVEGRELISHFDESDLDFDPRAANPGVEYVMSRGILDATEMFDAKHFGIPPKEAECLDPQHRIMLEVAQTALEDAGHDPDRFNGRIGIFCGASQSSYLLNNLLSAPGAARALAADYPVKNFATTLGNDKDFLATRLAYKLNLTGPAMAVQTACSTALTAVAQACSALTTGQADMVLAGAVSVTFPTRRPYAYLPEGMASADGHCRTFDAGATGTVFGDGAGVVVLRRLDDALEDGDEIIAVIRGIGINNDGSEKAGYAAPSVKAQTQVIQAAHAAAHVTPREIGYIEAHGTATPLGDPIEFTALQAAFGSDTDARGFCAIGSAKTNIGHLDIAAGVAGLIKTALVLKHRKIPPLLHFETPNPQIDFEQSAFYPVTELQDWKSDDAPRLAGVSALGVGGTNVHIVLEEAPAAQPDDANEKPCKALRIFPVATSSPDALNAAVGGLQDFAACNPNADPDRVVATLRRGRRQFAHRSVLVARDMTNLSHATATRSFKAGQWSELAMLFPGQGAQHVGMGKDLFDAEPVFRDALRTCTEILEPELGLNLLDVIHAPDTRAAEMTDALRQTELAQPAIFATSYALSKQWEHWGVHPDVLVGHSIGEFVAATLAGVVRLEDALRLIALRGRLMADLPKGVMVSVRASEDDVQPYLSEGFDLAAVNAAHAVVLAGPLDVADRLLPQMEADGHVVSRLHTSHAFHSRMMDPAIKPFRDGVSKLDLSAPQVPILSTVTGDWLSDKEAQDPDYWAMHMRRPVRLYDALQVLWGEGRHAFLESGPGRTLSTLAGQKPDRTRAQPAIASLPHAQSENGNSHVSMLEGFGHLWACGFDVNWEDIDGDRPEARRLSGLPTYPFQRTRHWREPEEVETPPTQPATRDPVQETEEAQPVKPVDTGAAVRDMLSDLSGIDPAEMDGSASFLELGFDSLLLTQATREITDRFSVRVALRQLIDGLSSIDALAAHIEAHGAVSSPKSAAPVAEAGPVAPQIQAAETPPEPSSAPLTAISRDTKDISPEQRAHIDDIVARFTAKTPKSKSLTQNYRAAHADPRTASGFNRLWKEGIYQVISERSKGSRLIDVDGNEYIDLLNGFGPGFLGHGHPAVKEAVKGRLERGFEVGPQHIEAMEAAQLFCDLTGSERASFVCTGSEAVYAAMRLARTVTNRDTIVLFQRDYHGNFDEVLVRGLNGKNGPRSLPLTPGIPNDAVKNVVVLPYGEPESLDWIRQNADTLAAVLVEPVQSRRPELQPFEFVRDIRRITERCGALMIFDEVITGFRFGLRGAQAMYGVEADLATYGKIVGGEIPVGVVAGKARYMDTFDGGHWQYGDDSFPEAPVTFFAGTFVRHPLAMAAVRAVLTYLKAQPDYFWRAVNAKGDRLAGTMHRWFQENDLPFEYPNCGSLMYLRIGEDQKFGGLLGMHLRARGVFALEGFPSYMTAAHSDAEIDFIIAAMQDSVLEMRAHGMLTDRRAVPYSGPKIDAAPPRLSLPCGPEAIDAELIAPTEPLTVPSTTAQKEIFAALSITPELFSAYNERYVISLRGPDLDIRHLQTALEKAVSRHDALSSVFCDDGHNLRLGATAAHLEHVDLSQSDDSQRIRDDLLAREATHPFDLEAGPLARFFLVRMAFDHVELVISAHHIVFDGWSAGTLLRDICQHYRSGVTGEPLRLPPADNPADYGRLENAWLRSDAGEAAQAFWRLQFADLPEPVCLPADTARTGTRNVRAHRKDFVIDDATTARLRKAARGMGVTLFSLLFAGFKLFVAKRSGQTDMTVAVPSAGQSSYGLENLVLHAVNLMPVRSRIDPSQSVREWTKSVSRSVLEAQEHQRLTYGSIVQSLELTRDLSQTPLTTMTFNLDPALGEDELDFAGVQADFKTAARETNNFELELNLADKGEEIVAEWTYQTALFESATIERFMADYLTVLEQAVASPDTSAIAVLAAAPEELADLGRAAIGPTVTLPDATLTDLINAQIALDGDATAIETSIEALSYAALDKLANRFANTLTTRGVSHGDRVGIALARGPMAIAAMLGTLRVGATYLPLDPSFPAERLRFMVEDADTVLVVADAGSEGLVQHIGAPVFLADTDQLSTVSDPVQSDTSGADIAYLLYTSGSTGKPKGVAVSHRAFVNFITSMAREPGLFAGQRVLATTTLSFDIAGLEIWGPLTKGGTILLASRDEVLEPRKLQEKIETCDLIQATPATYEMLLEAGWHGHPDLTVLIGGETVPQDLAGALIAGCKEVWNMYGPTETTVWSTIARLDGGPIHVGHPIANTELVVVAPETLIPLPPGSTGELMIGGSGLADGYHNRPDLTAEKFVMLPGRGRFYRTGDLGRFVRRTDGWTLDLIGRADGQVKLRGYRIETGDIDAALRNLPGIAQAKTLVAGDGPSNAHLVAAVTLSPGTEPRTAEWRETLRGQLPPYMVPNRIVGLPQMPLTPNGKIDRQALIGILRDKSNADLAPEPSTMSDTESMVAGLWCELFEQTSIGPSENFFDLGGNSLMAVTLFEKLRKTTGVNLPISTLFQNQTVRSLAHEITANVVTQAAPAADWTQRGAPSVADPNADWDTTVVIHPGPAQTGLSPIFIVGGVGGNVNNLYSLGQHLGRTRRLIGFQTRGIMGHNPHNSIEDVAAEYIRHLNQHQPAGPYVIAAYSGGSYAGLEIVRQLEAAGEEVEHLVILDSYTPAFSKIVDSLNYKGAGLPWTNLFDTIRARGISDGVEYLRGSLSGFLAKGPLLHLRRFTNAADYRFRVMRKVWWNAAKNYEGGPIAAPVTLIISDPVSRQEKAAVRLDPSMGWRDVSPSGGVNIVKTQGDHFDLLDGENAEARAQDMLDALQAPKYLKAD